MIKLLFPLPRQVTVAFSGGVDSVAAVDFLSKNHEVTCAFFHHGTQNSERALNFVTRFCTDRNLAMFLGVLNRDKPKDMSYEEFWREERYDYLATLGPVITAHHLDDCVETYIWSALHGKPKVPNLVRGNVIRPFLTTHKNKFVGWCQRKNLGWCEDLSNEDERYTRNYIRKNLVPHALKVNPGLHKTVKKIVEKQL
jgi:tRNA(Ile)-lysidine synthetase-like protein